MAQMQIVELFDDLDGSSDESVATVTFELAGMSYEIDLNEANAARLRDGLARYIGSARSAGRTMGGAALAADSNLTKAQRQAIRGWAREDNWAIADRGRIPAEILEAYEQATRTPR